MAVGICEVGPRDGLQNQKRLFGVEERVALIQDLAGAGLRHIEAVSFASAARVPQMAEPEAVLAALDIDAGVRLAGLTMNEKGVERALSTRLDEIRYVVLASETFSRRNQNASIAEALAALDPIARRVRAAGKSFTVLIAAAFGCPFEGEIPAQRVAEIARRVMESGPDELLLADTIGVGVPAQVAELTALVRPLLGERKLGFHFHNTRNTGYANAFMAVSLGADTLDASVGGLGGCPFAPRATGNIATEDLAYLLSRGGSPVELDYNRMFAIVERLKAALPGEITGQLHSAGLFPG